MPGFGCGTGKKKTPVAGICWCVAKWARRPSRTIAYPMRRWDAWHHHMALVMLGTLFLVKQKKAGRQQWPMLSFNDLVTALAHLLPRRQLTAE